MPLSTTLFSVQHFCLHDGPGVRSLVFFKGCPLRCRWCQNPESWRARPELGFKAELCIDCRACVAACVHAARHAPGLAVTSSCEACFACADACPTTALSRFGEARSVAALVDELRPEFPLFRESGGGVTLSGGEPTQAASFAAELVAALRAENIGVAMETCGQFGFGAATAALIVALELILFDIKLVDSAEHQRWCGIGNQTITANLSRLVAMAARGEGPPVWPRLPLVPGATDGRDNLRGWAELLGELGLAGLTLVPYHRLGSAKHDWMGTSGQTFATPGDEVVEAVITTLGELGITAYLPGEEPWR